MVFHLHHEAYELNDLCRSFTPSSETEQALIDLVKQWTTGNTSFVFNTSGSTGKPKSIEVSRDKIELSTRNTFAFVDPHHELKKSLLCINPSFIGGAMVVFRALIFNQDLWVVEPSSNPFQHLNSDQHYDLTSMVPLQFNSCKVSDLNKIKIIIIGGAPLKEDKEGLTSAVYCSFGMTETVSHFALRKYNETWYSTTGDARVRRHLDASLEVKGSITDHKWLQTNDIVELLDDKTFKWVGRKDFIINSGGFKVSPEKLERILGPQFSHPFLISSIPDEKLTNKVVLIHEGKVEQPDFSKLHPYERPRLLIQLNKIPRTSTGKLDRNSARALALQHGG